MLLKALVTEALAIAVCTLSCTPVSLEVRENEILQSYKQ